MKANYKRDISTKQIDKLINEQLIEAAHREEADTMALVCYILHEKFGFGKKRIEVFMKEYHSGLDELCNGMNLKIPMRYFLQDVRCRNLESTQINSLRRRFK